MSGTGTDPPFSGGTPGPPAPSSPPTPPPTPGETIDAVRAALEALHREIALETYHHGSGQKQTLRTAPIVERYAPMLGGSTLRLLLEAARGTDDEAEQRRLRMLALAVAEVAIDSQLADVTDELATAEATSSISVEGTDLLYRAAPIAIQNELDRDRRRRIDAALMVETARLNPLRTALFRRHHEMVAELGFDGYVGFYTSLQAIDLRALGAQMLQFLAATRALYLELISRWYEESMEIPFGHAERHDASVLFRMSEHDRRFPADRMRDTLRGALLALGIAIDEQTNVRIDVEDRPSKSARAFCAAVRAPEEVYLVLRPTGGYQDYRALFHEAGHAEHFANVDQNLRFEDRLLGDNSVTEAYAFSLEHLLLDPVWLEEALGIDAFTAQSISRRAHAYLLYMLRRYAAKLTYELRLHGDGIDGLPGMPERYASWMTEHLGFRHRPEPYLGDVDPGFYSARYLRAWMLEGQLVDRWRTMHGERWWRPGGAGDEMRRLWSMGQMLPADALAATLGMHGLTTDTLERRLDTVLGSHGGQMP